jgi:hypothetical protein
MKFPREILPQIWWDPLRQLEVSATSSCKDWLASGHYAVDQCGTKSFEIILPSETLWAGHLAFEINLWVTASFETMHSVSAAGVLPKSSAWAFIQAYYAAFFAAHSLLRFHGCLFSSLDRNHVQAIHKAALGSGLTTAQKPDEGNYEIWLDRGNRKIIATAKRDSHADLWATSLKFLKEIKLKLPTLTIAPPSRDLADYFIDDLSRLLTNNGASSQGNWLSSQRNLINYRKGLGLWYPYSKSSPELSDVFEGMKRWEMSSPSYHANFSGTDPSKIVEATNAIVWLAKLFVNAMDATRKNKKSFIDNGVLKYLKQVEKPLARTIAISP